jgi:hypothetical protein
VWHNAHRGAFSTDTKNRVMACKATPRLEAKSLIGVIREA